MQNSIRRLHRKSQHEDWTVKVWRDAWRRVKLASCESPGRQRSLFTKQTGGKMMILLRKKWLTWKLPYLSSKWKLEVISITDFIWVICTSWQNWSRLPNCILLIVYFNTPIYCKGAPLSTMVLLSHITHCRLGSGFFLSLHLLQLF